MDLIMLPAMSVHESVTLDRILKAHEDELIRRNPRRAAGLRP
jgi:hypothetical protein